MRVTRHSPIVHPRLSRREWLQAGSIGLMGLSLSDVEAAREANRTAPQKSVIYLFLSGGLGQHDSFDMKPDAPANIRGEFEPISTRTPGLQICEHLPHLAACSDKWAVVRSLSHSTNGHSLGHHIMLTGRSDTPRGFSGNMPQATDHPSIVSQVGYLLRDRSRLPAAAVIPDMLTHHSGRIIPGQFGGVMGERHDPWVINAAPQCQMYGACPNCFDHQRRPMQHVGSTEFQPPNLALAEGVTQQRLEDRTRLLSIVERQQSHLDRLASVSDLGRYRESAISLLSSSGVRKAFDLSTEPDPVRSLYGRNLYGSSCLLARRLIECGVGLVQVNMGRNETWDTHGNAFPNLKNNLLPPMDQSVASPVAPLVCTSTKPVAASWSTKMSSLAPEVVKLAVPPTVATPLSVRLPVVAVASRLPPTAEVPRTSAVALTTVASPVAPLVCTSTKPVAASWSTTMSS